MATKEFQMLSGEVKAEMNVCIANRLKVLNVPPDILCSNCGVIPIFHFISSCSHVYCQACHNLFLREKRKCIKCTAVIENKTKQDKKIEYAIYNLQAECPNTEHGCNKHVTLQYLPEHLASCKFNKENLFPKLYKGTSIQESQKEIIENLSKDFEAKLQIKATEFTEKMNTVLEQLQKQTTETAEMRRQLQKQSEENAEMRQLLKAKETVSKSDNDAKLYCDQKIKELERKLESTVLLNKVQLSKNIDKKIFMCNNKIEQLEREDLEANNKMREIESTVDEIITQELVKIRQSQKELVETIAAMKVP